MWQWIDVGQDAFCQKIHYTTLQVATIHVGIPRHRGIFVSDKQEVKAEYISIADTAIKLNVSASTVRKLIDNKIFTAFYVTRTLPRLKLADVEAYMERKKQRG